MVQGRASVGLAYERFFAPPFGSGESQRLSTGGPQNDNVGCDASNAGCRVWSREVRRREAAPLKAKGAAPDTLVRYNAHCRGATDAGLKPGATFKAKGDR